MEKIHLDENFDIVVDDPLAASSLINQLIKSEWEQLDLYNSIVATVQELHVKQKLEELVNDHYIAVGQLEKLLMEANQAAAEGILTGLVDQRLAAQSPLIPGQPNSKAF